MGGAKATLVTPNSIKPRRSPLFLSITLSSSPPPPCPLSCTSLLTILSASSFICTGTFHPCRSPLFPLNFDALQVIRHDRLKHDVKLIGTIAFKHDSNFTGRVVSSGDTALGSVALVCGIGLYRSLEVASMSGCWCVSSTCLGSVLPALLVLLLFLSLVVLVSYHYLLRFDVLGCGLLALCCVVCSLWVPVSLCPLFDLACLLCLTCSFSSSPCLLSWPSLFLLIAVACFLCFTWSSLSPLLAVALILVSDVSCQSLLVSVFVLAYLNLIFLLVYLVLAVIHSRWPWSVSATLSISLGSLRFLSISFWFILATLSAHLGPAPPDTTISICKRSGRQLGGVRPRCVSIRLCIISFVGETLAIDNEALAPYQQRPLQGSSITHHYATQLRINVVF
ncbi:hypothetical protein HETIRDRAFT_309468 [Heterobasidion irregulare TC 32-1]|uniref:Uncharacterized protein n=1 Tax=Heterobasidion irregulare (strain TC 32-1) TaxID=747525 RepID=W4KHX8_HETIT|nr:uncharacterized protein HETIRDRAFT_309468 [Heterobasidion irregulare TC 32-1]ETW85284.1 hypothetical protein HETIRDRAFT_309468 [Heterobasidion irregulare TC 32-1]